MKAFKTVVLGLALNMIAMTGFSQTVFNEGILEYDITVSSGNVPAGLENAKLVVYLSPDASRKESISGVGTETNVYNKKTGKGFILKEFSSQKLMITLNAADWALLNRKNAEANFTFSNETKTLLGRTVKTATGTYSDGKTITVYYDPAVTLANKDFHNNFPQLPGLPVQYEMQSGNLTFSYTLRKITEQSVPDSKFEAPRSGFRVMSFEESQQLKRGAN